MNIEALAGFLIRLSKLSLFFGTSCITAKNIENAGAKLELFHFRRRNDADSRKQGGAGGSVLKYVTDGGNAADDEDAHSGERKYAGG